MQPYFTRLKEVSAERGAFCVGIDPHPHLLQAWGLDDSATGLESCARDMVAAIGDQVAAFKPQSAFFERHGAAGVAVLERVLADIAQTEALSILDAKRGDIGSTMAAYADTYLADGSPLAADAVTLSPYLGVGALEPAISAAHATGRGIYLLCRTSNPEGAAVQAALSDGASVAQQVVDQAAASNAHSGDNAIGLVIGATHHDLGLDLDGFAGSILVPGIGTQGGSVADITRLLGAKAGLALPTSSRQIMFAGPDAQEMRDAVAATMAGDA